MHEHQRRPVLLTWDFCADLITFLGLATWCYEHAHYYGELRLTVNIMVPEGSHFSPGRFHDASCSDRSSTHHPRS
jgi:hypothetical protein